MTTPDQKPTAAAPELQSFTLADNLKPDFVFNPNSEHEVHLTENGITYNGQTVTDAGELYAAMSNALARFQSSKLPPPELTWIYTHCRDIGMTCKSESGKWEHDIALFTQNMQEKIAKLEAELAQKQAELCNQSQDAATAAIKFVMDELDDGTELDFLRAWNEGEFDVIRKEWPEAPEAVFIGADPLHPKTKVDSGNEPPPPCDPAIFSEGRIVAVLESGMHVMEALAKEANRHANVKVDWHYVGGRAVVKTLGDTKVARHALTSAIPRIIE